MESKYVNYRGPSMNPLFKNGDGLEVVAYGARPVRRGDVIVFPNPLRDADVVHRVIEVLPEGVRSRGDNNAFVDEYVTPFEAIKGRVVARKRGAKQSRVWGGTTGRLLHGAYLTRRRAHLWAIEFLRPLYHRAAATGMFYGWHKPFTTTKTAVFHRGEGVEMQLLAGRRLIGWRAPGETDWFIRFPYRFFIDPKELPE
jgi:hypothetical protein